MYLHVRAQGLDLCMAMDLSRSMEAVDVAPSRLENAKNQFNVVLSEMAGHRISVIGFAGTGFVVAPQTIDIQAIQDFIDPVDPSYVSDQSTNFSVAIEACLDSFLLKEETKLADIAEEPAKAILIVSDGEDTGGDLGSSIERLKELKIPVYSIISGTKSGGRIPVYNHSKQFVEYLKDSSGEEVLSIRKSEVLEKISTETGAKIYYAEEGVQVWRDLLHDLQKFETDSAEASYLVKLKHRFVLFAILAFCFSFLSFNLPETRIFTFLAILCPSFLMAGKLDSQLSTDKVYLNPIEVLRNSHGKLKVNEKHFLDALGHFEKNLETDSSDLIFRLNWANTQLKQLFDKAANGDTRIGVQHQELLNEYFSLLGDVRKIKWIKYLKFQIAHVYELLQNNKKAIEYYYSVLAGGEASWVELDQASLSNASRLIELQQNNSGGGGGDSKNQSKQGESGQKNKGQGDSDPQKQKQEPKFKGKDLSKKQVDEILQSVGSEERQVKKRKSKEESKQGERRRGDESSGGRAQQW